tara:strand:+ start:3832 stop:4302 length:471 start_codon:yes stop_codon:yes gene_type:complete
MAYQKLQAYRALEVIPSNTIDIPNPAMLAVSSTTTSNAPTKLIDNTQDFTTNGVNVGDIVYTGAVAMTVTAIDNATTLTVTGVIGSGDPYSIYNTSEAPNNGCVLYVGGAGKIKVTTAGGDDVTFIGVLAGSFIPVQVVRVFASSATTATDIVALW